VYNHIKPKVVLGSPSHNGYFTGLLQDLLKKIIEKTYRKFEI